MSTDDRRQWDAMRRQLTIRRIVLGLTQTQAGRLAGTSKGAVANIEGGQRVPTAGTLIRLAAAYGLRVVLVPEEPHPTKEDPMPAPPCDWCRLIGATHVEADHPLPKTHPDYDALYDADPDELVSALLTDAEDV